MHAHWHNIGILKTTRIGQKSANPTNQIFFSQRASFLNIYLCINRFNQINAIFSCGFLQLAFQISIFFNTRGFFQTKSYTETCIKPRKVEMLLLWWTENDVPFWDLPFSMGLVSCLPILSYPHHGSWKTYLKNKWWKGKNRGWKRKTQGIIPVLAPDRSL